MAYADFAGIPDRALPLRGWPRRGIPGGEPAAVPTTGAVQDLAGMIEREREAPARRRRRDDKDMLDIVTMMARVLH